MQLLHNESPPGPSRPPESPPPSPGGSSSASRLSAGAALARAGSVACYAAGVLLAAFAALVALPLQAQAQKTTFVSNTGQSTDPDVREVGPHGHLWQLQAQQFRTGDNEGGYTLSAIQVRVDDFGSNSRPKVSIYTTSSGNPGSSLYVLTNPATLNDDAINSFRAPANATLEKDTNYFVVFEALGSGSTFDTTWRSRPVIPKIRGRRADGTSPTVRGSGLRLLQPGITLPASSRSQSGELSRPPSRSRTPAPPRTTATSCSTSRSRDPSRTR